MKNKDLCDHDPRCIMSCGLMVDDIIMYNNIEKLNKYNHSTNKYSGNRSYDNKQRLT